LGIGRNFLDVCPRNEKNLRKETYPDSQTKIFYSLNTKQRVQNYKYEYYNAIVLYIFLKKENERHDIIPNTKQIKQSLSTFWSQPKKYIFFVI
jgi:hypothetical protein